MCQFAGWTHRHSEARRRDLGLVRGTRLHGHRRLCDVGQARQRPDQVQWQGQRAHSTHAHLHQGGLSRHEHGRCKSSRHFRCLLESEVTIRNSTIELEEMRLFQSRHPVSLPRLQIRPGEACLHLQTHCTGNHGREDLQKAGRQGKHFHASGRRGADSTAFRQKRGENEGGGIAAESIENFRKKSCTFSSQTSWMRTRTKLSPPDLHSPRPRTGCLRMYSANTQLPLSSTCSTTHYSSTSRRKNSMTRSESAFSYIETRKISETEFPPNTGWKKWGKK